MFPTDRQEFGRILLGLAAIKPGGKLTPEALDLFWLAMQGWPIDEFRAAASYLVSAVEFMPSPYHFEQLRRAGRMTAGEAWAAAVKHVRSGNYRCSPSTTAVERVVRAIGGWSVIAMSPETSLPYIERRFAEAFDATQIAEDIRAALPQLTAPMSERLIVQSL